MEVEDVVKPDTFATFKAAELVRELGTSTTETVARESTDSSAEAGSDAASDTAKDTQGKRDRTFDGRLAELTAARKTAEEKATKLEEELRTLRTRKPDTEPVADKKTEKPAEDKEPNQDDYDTYDKWLKATVGWVSRQTIQTETQKQQELAKQEKTKQEVEERAKSIQKRFDEGRAKLPNFAANHEAMKAASDGLPDTAGVHVIVQSLRESDMPAQLVDYFGSHIEEYREIAALNDLRKAQRRIALIEHGLETPEDPEPAKPKTQPISKAPVPAQRVNGAAAQSAKDPAKATSFADFKRLEREREARAS